MLKSVALSREEGTTSAGGVGELATGGGSAVVEALVAAVGTGAVEANRMPVPFRIKGLVFEKESFVYIREDEAPFLENSGLGRMGVFRATEEHWRIVSNYRNCGFWAPTCLLEIASRRRRLVAMVCCDQRSPLLGSIVSS